MDSWYVLDSIHAATLRSYAGGQWVNHVPVLCPGCRSELSSAEPAEIEIALNHLGQHGFAEYLWNSHSLPLFRQDLIDLWVGAGLTGFTTRPVRISGWYEQPRKQLPSAVPVYRHMVNHSKVRLQEPPPAARPCPQCGYVRMPFPKVGTQLPRGIALAPESWDGADFFGIVGYRFVFCTRRAAEVTLQAHFNRHVAFVRSENWLRWDDFNVQRWTPKAYQAYVDTFLIRSVEDL